jgi:HlyD family secretion protein
LPSDNKTNAGIVSADFQVQIAQANLAADQAKSGDPASIAAAEAQITSAQIALDNLLKGGNPDDVARAQAQLQAAQSGLDLARANLAKATLLAPFDGVLAKLNLHIGEAPPAGPAAVMLDTSAFYVEVPVDEADVSRIAVGQTATLTLDALSGVNVIGKVSRIADTSVKSGDVVTYTIRIDIDPAGHPLLSAMSATATITTDQIKNVVRVRNRFVRLDRTTNQAFVSVRQPDGTFKEVEITLGLRNDTYSEVKSGLAAGDVIAVLQNSSTLLAPGSGNQGGGFGGPAR